MNATLASSSGIHRFDCSRARSRPASLAHPRRLRRLRLSLGWLVGAVLGLALSAAEVRVLEETLVLPTYEVGPPDPNPLFYSHESYQGAQKRVYPYPLIDRLTETRTNRAYRALVLENQYVRIVVLPELGGRLFEAVDKSNGYPFFYRQHVIKPALIGMLGAWISGGIEWCTFHHHRNTTFMPVDSMISHNPDGSGTVWIGETERRHRMKWLIGVTLHPDRSDLEVTGQFFNRTPFPHSILNWANVAVHVNEEYQILFPPSVQVATYHSKIDFSQWPVSQGRYRGVDYAGVDLSWWKNHPEPVSFFAWDLQEDFMGGYDHGRQAGVAHVANHHVVTGAKLWEWGTGTEGRRWDRILTDDDGPYAELMVGAFSDNQPDYSWIQPGEVKQFEQRWFPVRDIGGFKFASPAGAVNLERLTNGLLLVGFNTTRPHTDARARLTAGGRVLLDERVQIAPDRPVRREVSAPTGVADTDLRAALVDGQGQELLAYQPRVLPPAAGLPSAVKPPPPPGDIATLEELFLAGLRIEQIHNPTVDPGDYYREAIRRDPGDSRSRTRLGLDCLRRGLPEEAETHLRAAVARVTADYTRALSAEPYLYLGLALRAQGRNSEAEDAFYRASWDPAWHTAACLQLAELRSKQRTFDAAVALADDALTTSARNTRVLGARAALLRHRDRAGDALASAQAGLAIDPLDFLCRHEAALAQATLGRTRDAETTRSELRRLMRDDVQAYLELGTDYLNLGLWDEAIAVLSIPVESRIPFAATYPLVHYYLGYLREQASSPEAALADYRRAAQMPLDYCFPFRAESRAVLNAALRANPSDARAHYYLGNLLFENQPDAALVEWDRARTLDPTLAPAYRNLGWGEYRSRNNLTNAIAAYERAVALQGHDPRYFTELDLIYEAANTPPARRHALLAPHHPVLAQRSDSLEREIRVLVLVGQYDRALELLDGHFFHVREGGGDIHDVYVDAHLLRGWQAYRDRQYTNALAHFIRAADYPENLSVGRPKADRRAPQIEFAIGSAHTALGRPAEARQALERGATPPGPEGDRAGDSRFYEGLCLAELGRPDEARRCFDQLIESGTRDLDAAAPADYFAKFGEQQTRTAREARAHYRRGLGHLGKGDRAEARVEFAEAVRLNQSLVWARYQLAQLDDKRESATASKP